MLNEINHENILVSVIMCVYNTPEDYLEEAVLSILNQTHRNLELIIVDDCSDHNLFENHIFNDDRVKILRNDKNYGPAYSRNKALSLSKGTYIAIMDSDDISLPTRLEDQITFLEKNSNVVACGTWYQHIGAKNNIVQKVIDDNEYYRCCLLFGNNPTLINPSAMIRKDVLERNNIIYDNELRFGEDYKMWVQLAKLGIVTNLKKVLIQYRIHEKQVTKGNARKRQSLKYDAKVKLMQLEEISKDFRDDEKELFVQYYGDKRVKPKAYYNLLSKISVLNKQSNVFNQQKLDLRIAEQWEAKLLCTNNPFTLLSTFFAIKKERKNIILIKLNQIKNKIFHRRSK